MNDDTFGFEFESNHMPAEMASKLLEQAPRSRPTDEQREVLDLLAEESAEVIQRCTKIQRFGKNAWRPGDQTTEERLAEEIGHARAATFAALVTGQVSVEIIDRATIRKLRNYASGKVTSRMSPEVRQQLSEIADSLEML